MNRKQLLLLVLALTVGLFVVGCGGGGESSTTNDVAPRATATSAGDAVAGEALFSQTCSACHGADAKGLPGLGKDMTTSVFIHDQSDDQLLAFIKTGRPMSDPANTTGVDMPPKGGNPAITDEQLLDIIAFIRTKQQSQ